MADARLCTGRVVADAQLRHEIALYERARLGTDDERLRAAWGERLASLWAELLATSPLSVACGGPAATVTVLPEGVVRGG